MNEVNAAPITLSELWSGIWKKKVLIIAAGVLFAALGVAIALMLPNKFTSKVLLVPIQEDQDGLSSLAKNLGGLAGVAGIKLGRNRGPDKSDIALEVIKSQAFINDFVNKYELLVPLMASEGANKTTYELIINEKAYNQAEGKWVREVEPPKTPEPSPEEVKEAFLNILDIEVVPKTGFVMLAIEFYSPVLAKEWLDLLVFEINNKMRELDREEAESSLAYLNKVLEDTNNQTMQDTFYQLVEEQTKTLMLVESRPEYIFKTVSPAIAPEKKSGPKRALIVVFFGFLGGILSTSLVILSVIMRHDNAVKNK